MARTGTITNPDKQPIELKMSEVEVLREAAKKNNKLRKILEKFTDYIKVKVDFPPPED